MVSANEHNLWASLGVLMEPLEKVREMVPPSRIAVVWFFLAAKQENVSTMHQHIDRGSRKSRWRM